MLSFFKPTTQTVVSTLNSLAYLGLLLTVSSAVEGSKDYWIWPEGYTLPEALQGVDIETYRCEVFCHIDAYKRALQDLVNSNHPVYSNMASQVLTYCAEGIMKACETGIAACLPGASEEETNQFMMGMMVKAAPYFPRP